MRKKKLPTVAKTPHTVQFITTPEVITQRPPVPKLIARFSVLLYLMAEQLPRTGLGRTYSRELVLRSGATSFDLAR
jgi:hypothetical protein